MSFVYLDCDVYTARADGCRITLRPFVHIYTNLYRDQFGSEESSAALIRRQRKLPADGADLSPLVATPEKANVTTANDLQFRSARSSANPPQFDRVRTQATTPGQCPAAYLTFRPRILPVTSYCIMILHLFQPSIALVSLITQLSLLHDS